jgi:hypothetical protein
MTSPIVAVRVAAILDDRLSLHLLLHSSSRASARFQEHRPSPITTSPVIAVARAVPVAASVIPLALVATVATTGVP